MVPLIFNKQLKIIILVERIFFRKKIVSLKILYFWDTAKGRDKGRMINEFMKINITVFKAAYL